MSEPVGADSTMSSLFAPHLLESTEFWSLLGVMLACAGRAFMERAVELGGRANGLVGPVLFIFGWLVFASELPEAALPAAVAIPLLTMATAVHSAHLGNADRELGLHDKLISGVLHASVICAWVFLAIGLGASYTSPARSMAQAGAFIAMAAELMLALAPARPILSRIYSADAARSGEELLVTARSAAYSPILPVLAIGMAMIVSAGRVDAVFRFGAGVPPLF